MHRSALPRCLVVVTLAVAGAANPARAALTDLIPNLFGTRVVLAPPTGNFPSHETHFVDESLALRATGHVLNESLVAQLSTFPLASSAGGFTYTFDPALGTFTRSAESFGPAFTERAQTIGKGRWNVGFNFLQASYDTLDELELDQGDLTFQLLHVDSGGDGRTSPFFEGDIINVNTFLEVDSQTTVLFANYGVSDRFDVSFAVPVVRVELDARARLAIDRLSTGLAPGIHQFVGGGDTIEFRASDSASGVGDVLVRGKYRLVDFGRGGLAAAADVRLPTGDEEDLLGTGYTQGKLSLLASGGFGRVSPHANLGYATSTGDSEVLSDLPDEVSYAFGLDVAVHPRVTVAGELVGRTLLDARRAQLDQRPFQFVQQNGQPGVAQRPVVTFVEDDLDLLLGGVGVKFNPGGNLLVSLDALVSLSDDGLQDDGVIGVFGLEYSF